MSPISTHLSSRIIRRAGIASLLATSSVAFGALPAQFDLAKANASFYGEQELDSAGFQAVGVGDVNGDFLDDLLISAPGANGQRGKVYLIFGRTDGLEPLTDLAEADASFVGEAAGDQAGMGIAAAGDFNKDGLADFVIGAPFNSQRDYAAGKVYLIYGRTSGWAKDTSLANADVSFVGEASMALTGFAISALGDLNKDGNPDLAIGAHGMNGNAGKVYLVMGGSSPLFTRDMEVRDMPSFAGEAANNYAGFSLAGVGDVNGDGYHDLLIGAYGNSHKATQAGKAYLIYGRTGTWSKGSPLSQVGTFYLGQSARDYAGYSVAAAGDLDRDGMADFLIGAPGRDKNGDGSGMSAVVYGRSGNGGAYDLGQVDASLNGERAGDSAAAAIGPAGDIDKDGYADLLVSGHFSDRKASDAGAAYLFRGGRSRLAGSGALSAAATVFLGERSLDQAGWSVRGAGDVDGDGFDDLLISAHGNDYHGMAAGMVYLVFSGPLVDLDGDGFSVAGGDCNDSNAAQHPGALEIPRNGIDEDCNGVDSSAPRRPFVR